MTATPSGPPTRLAIRDAIPADADAIARLHHAVWHQTYAALAPPDLPPLMTLESRQTRWRTLLDGPSLEHAFVADAGMALAGFVLMGPATEPAFGACCEIRHLFVRADMQGRGLGRRLMADAARRAIALGFTRLGLGVVEGNRAAIRFYEGLGGIRAGSYTDPGPRWRSHNLIFAWDDLATLADRAAGRIDGRDRPR